MPNNLAVRLLQECYIAVIILLGLLGMIFVWLIDYCVCDLWLCEWQSFCVLFAVC